MDQVTRQKSKYLEDHGYTVTGHILTNPESGKRALLEHGRVVWLEEEEAMVVLGHKEVDTDATKRYPGRQQYTLTEGRTRSNIKTPDPNAKRPAAPPPAPRPKNG